MTNKITAKDLMDNYKNAIIIDMDKKNVIVIKNKTIKVYPEKRYREILDNFGIIEFND